MHINTQKIIGTAARIIMGIFISCTAYATDTWPQQTTVEFDGSTLDLTVQNSMGYNIKLYKENIAKELSEAKIDGLKYLGNCTVDNKDCILVKTVNLAGDTEYFCAMDKAKDNVVKTAQIGD